ncbi:MAG: glycosyltransferase family 4 protein [Parcubacteria group bacterium]|nr:glycosyltransferase family 4 protein [Parcubacteria group bacterium]
MKILIISNLYEPYQRGGAEVVVKRTILALQRAGHEVVLFTSRPYEGLDSLKPAAEGVNGLRIWRFYPLNIFFYTNDSRHALPLRLLWHAFDLFNIHSSRMVRRVLRQEKPDLIISHNLISLGFFVPAEIRRAGSKHIHILHDIQLAMRKGLMQQGEEQRFYTSGWLGRLYQAITRRQFGSPNLVISPSRFLLDFYRRLGFFAHSRLEVLRNPIDKMFYRAPRLSTPQPQRQSGIRLAFIGQLAEHKGLHTLRQAFSHIADNHLQLLIVGSGPLEAEMRQWQEQDKRVQYLGRLGNEALPQFLASIDAVIMPTKTYENSPTVVFEALAAGVPVIASDIGGTGEPVQEGKTGFLVPSGNVAALTDAINHFIKLKNSGVEFSQACTDSVAGLDEDAYIKQLLALIDQSGR